MSDDVSEFIETLLLKKGPIPGASREEKLAYRYLDTGHIDSFNLIRFIMEIEDHFGIVLEPADTESDEFRYLGGLADLVKSKLPGR